MGRNDHLDERKTVYVKELEDILDEIEYWEEFYEMSDIPGFRDPEDKKIATSKIAELNAKFEAKKKELEENGLNVYR